MNERFNSWTPPSPFSKALSSRCLIIQRSITVYQSPWPENGIISPRFGG